MPYTIGVDFEIYSAAIEQFIELVAANARLSLATEPGCRRFEVHRVLDNPNRVVLYEAYDDREAFEQHLAMAHFREFDEAAKRVVVSKTVIELEKLN